MSLYSPRHPHPISFLHHPLIMSLNPYPKQSLNFRILQVKSLILAHDKFVHKLLVLIADVVIDKSAKLVTGSEVVEKQAKVQAIKGVGEC